MSVRRECSRGGWVDLPGRVRILTAADGMLWVAAPRGTDPAVIAGAMIWAGIEVERFRDPDPASDQVDLHKTRRWHWRPEDDGGVALARIVERLCGGVAAVPVKVCDTVLNLIEQARSERAFAFRYTADGWQVSLTAAGGTAYACDPSLERAMASCYCRHQSLQVLE